MAQGNQTMFKSSMYYGAITGGALTLTALITKTINGEHPTSIGFIAVVILVVGIMFSTRNYRERQMAGEITYGQALGFGLLHCVFAGFIYAFYFYLIYKAIDREAISQFYINIQQVYLEAGVSEDELAELMGVVRKLVGPGAIAFSYWFTIIFYGLIFSLIGSIFLKREHKDFEDRSN